MRGGPSGPQFVGFEDAIATASVTPGAAASVVAATTGAAPWAAANDAVRAAAAGIRSPEAVRIIRLLLAVACILVSALFLRDRFILAYSDEAVVTAATASITAPIAGVFSSDHLRYGTLIAPGTSAGAVDNQRADPTTVAALRAEIATTQQEIVSLRMRLTGTGQLSSETMRHFDDFRAARVQQLRDLRDETQANLAAAHARGREAAATARRIEPLFAKGFATAAATDQARQALAVATYQEEAVRHRLGWVETELQAAMRGIFTADGEPDRAASQQRHDDTQLRAEDFSGAIAEREGRLKALNERLAAAQAYFDKMRHADLTFPVTARLLQIAAQDGEFVTQGQLIATYFDCDALLINATVAQRVFKRLEIGESASFSPSSGGPNEKVRVVQLLSPLSLAFVPLAELQSLDRADTYHVVLATDGDAAPRRCDIGRNGTVTF